MSRKPINEVFVSGAVVIPPEPNGEAARFRLSISHDCEVPIVIEGDEGGKATRFIRKGDHVTVIGHFRGNNGHLEVTGRMWYPSYTSEDTLHLFPHEDAPSPDNRQGEPA